MASWRRQEDVLCTQLPTDEKMTYWVRSVSVGVRWGLFQQHLNNLKDVKCTHHFIAAGVTPVAVGRMVTASTAATSTRRPSLTWTKSASRRLVFHHPGRNRILVVEEGMMRRHPVGAREGSPARISERESRLYKNRVEQIILITRRFLMRVEKHFKNGRSNWPWVISKMIDNQWLYESRAIQKFPVGSCDRHCVFNYRAARTQ